MRIHALKTIILLLAFIFNTATLPQGINLGDQFLIALPKLIANDKTEVFFYLTSLNTNPIQVTITAMWLKETVQSSPLDQITVARMELAKYKVDKALFSTQETGKRSAIRLTGARVFSLSMTIGVSYSKLDMFVAVPVAAWGNTYYAHTFDYRPSITVVTNEGPNIVSIKLMVSRPRTFETTYGKVKYMHNGILTIELRKYEGFAISDCKRQNVQVGSLSGTHVSAALPVGVISGTCMFDQNVTPRCNENTRISIDDSDVVMDMLLPVETYGKEFITVFSSPTFFVGVLMAVASETETEVSFANDKYGGYDTTFLPHEGDVLQIAIRFAITEIISNKGISVVYMSNGSCLDESNKEMAMPAMYQLIPESLFYDNYIWVTPRYNALTTNNYVAVVRKTGDASHIYLDGLPLTKTTWINVVGKSIWQVGTYQVTDGLHTMFGTQSVYFGCYFFGLSDRHFGYFSAAGFMTVAINTPCNISSPSGQGDLTDNDCDGLIDEEKYNGVDDDKDGLIDEDCAKPSRRNGIWGTWKDWACSRNCSDTNFYRRRFCDHPTPENYGLECVGIDLEVKSSNCYVQDKCPGKCEKGSWDLNCKQSCSQCKDDCNKFEGSCKECENGFQFPNISCVKPCDAFRYGFRCQGNCLKKCKTECLDKVEGACPVSWWKYSYLLLFVLIVPFGLAFKWKYKSCFGDDKESSKKSSSSSSSTGSL